MIAVEVSVGQVLIRGISEELIETHKVKARLEMEAGDEPSADS
jgi:hypothetical protein